LTGKWNTYDEEAASAMVGVAYGGKREREEREGGKKDSAWGDM
jgi:hypothetical protein